MTVLMKPWRRERGRRISPERSADLPAEASKSGMATSVAEVHPT